MSSKIWIILTACAACIALSTGNVTAQDASPASADTMKYKPFGKLSSRLDTLSKTPALNLMSTQTQADALSLPRKGPGSISRDFQGRPLVYIRMTDISGSQIQALRDAGAQILHISGRYKVVSAYIDPAYLPSVALLGTVRNVREVLRPVRRASCPSGAIVSEGVNQLRALLARSTYGIDGSGVQVGVLSDSYNQDTTAVTSAANDIASGDLPGAANPCTFTSAVNVLQDDPGGADEGRAIMQIVHDLAPGATLSFATADISLFSFADNIRSLRAAGADIIVDDVSWYDEPFFQEGPVNVAISDVVSAGALYFTAAGNDNLIINGHNISSYEAPAYRPTSCPAGVTAFATSHGWSYMDCHNFEPVSGVNANSAVALASGCELNVNFQWNEPWNGVSTDFDIFLLDAGGNVVAFSDYYNIGTEPFEFFYYSNNSASQKNYSIVIARFEGSTPRIKYVFMQNGSSCIASVQYNTSNAGDIVGPSLTGHAATQYGFSVAAVPYNNSNSPEYYTSRGPATHYFGPVADYINIARPITPYVLQQPDFSATDGGCTTFFYPPLDAGCYRFYGTSAAAPHAAAVTALLKQKANQLPMSLSPTVTRHVLQTAAQTVSGGGLNSTGAGLLDANAAVARLLGLEPVIRVQGSTIIGGYTTVQAAYNNSAASGDVIEMIASTFNETLLFNASRDVTLRGGFSSEFPSQSGITTVHGTLTINNGKVTIDRLVLQ